jgi:1-acyl-sn-glycerol-3-phosphate acyltransferase
MIGKLYRRGLYLIAPITILAACVHVALGVLYAMLTFGWIGPRGRDAAIMAWSRILLLMIGVRLDSRGLPPQPGGSLGSLLLINHTSWLDVFSIAAIVPARFVSKSEIGRWPLFGWLAIVVGTLFVERGRRHAVMRTNQAVAERLRSGQLIGVFPEGTTTDGTCLLPFHANLVQPAIDLAAAIRPVGVRFTQRGEFSKAAMFVGEMSLMQSLWRVVTAPYLTAELHWLPPIDPPPTTRHGAARAARAAIAHELNIPLDEHEVHGSDLSPAAETDDTEPGPRSAPAG